MTCDGEVDSVLDFDEQVVDTSAGIVDSAGEEIIPVEIWVETFWYSNYKVQFPSLYNFSSDPHSPINEFKPTMMVSFSAKAGDVFRVQALGPLQGQFIPSDFHRDFEITLPDRDPADLGFPHHFNYLKDGDPRTLMAPLYIMYRDPESINTTSKAYIAVSLLRMDAHPTDYTVLIAFGGQPYPEQDRYISTGIILGSLKVTKLN